MTQQVYEDQWCEIFDRSSADLIELRWFDTTATMSAQEFQSSLMNFASSVERCRRRSVLIDSTSFRMNPANMDGPWRDANIIPRYNAAGVTRFAFHMPQGMPLIGAAPAPEGPATFPTGYFGSRRAALDWLAG